MSDQRYPLLLDVRGAAKLVNLSPNTIKSLPGFPSPVRLDGVRALRWRTADVHAWVSSQAPRGEGASA